MKNEYFSLKWVLSFLFVALFSTPSFSQEKIVQVGAGEYLTTYRTNLGNLYVTRWGGPIPSLHNYGLSNVIDVDGAQYTNVALTASGNVYVVGVSAAGSPYTTLVPTDNLGNPFVNNSKVYGFYQSYLTLRNGTVWYWGTDDVLFMNNGAAVPRPIQLIQPAGKTMVKLSPASSTTFAGSAMVIGLASDGTVWQWNRNSRSPSQVTFPGNIAKDVILLGHMCYVIETTTDLFAWGYDPSYAGGRPTWMQSGIQSVKAAWVNAGCVFPLKELVGNYNTLHVIDANDNMFASGANPQGNIGNGIQYNPWKNATTPWNWSWLNGEVMTPPTQIPGKFKNICTSNTITFYLYAQDMGDDWYSWGRNKAFSLGNGKTLDPNGYAAYPEALNVPAPTLVTPLAQPWSVLTFNPNAQQPPLSHAGINQYITGNSTTLYGSGSSQQDGSITNYSWAKISGPNANIVSPNSMNTQVNGLVSGTYIFSLTITNNYGVTHTSTVKVVVGNGMPANQAPTANAGNDQTITLPTNSVLLTGSGADSDGTISMIQWSKISGPTQGNFVSPTAYQTRVNNLVQGVYLFQLEVTDNGGAKGRDTVKVTVLPAPNQAPVVITSSDISITLPANEAPLQGTVTDADGTIVSILWTMVSGGSGVIDNPQVESTTVTGLEPGLYTFALTATDDDGAVGSDTLLVMVNPAVNQAPMAIAGPNQSVTTASSVTLNGDGYDPDGVITSMQWRKVQGGNVTIQNPVSGVTGVTNLSVDVYKFELTVTDDMGASARDTMQLVVTAAPNQPPTANAGPDININLPVNYVSITGAGSDPDGTITGYLWSKLSGPAATISNAFSSTVNITNMVEGIYVFRLRVTDSDGATATDNVVVNVGPAPNQMPTANAGADITITLPTNSVTLNGSGNDPDGSIDIYQWTKISGPNAIIGSPNSASTSVTNLVEGHYIFQLTITDNRGGTATDEVEVVVLRAPNQAPIANAGSDQTITLPLNNTALSGSGTDTDGTIVAYRWSKISGPFVTIANVAARNTNISGLQEGSYVFELRVTDNDGAYGRDSVTITVLPQPNQPPVVSAGSDITITLPVNYVDLSATASDPDGVINSYQWTKVSGPAATIVSPLNSATRISGLVQGNYIFRVRVIDNLGAEANADVHVTVLRAPNQAPTANAGSNITITLPQSSATLSGSGSDADGSIVGYNWTQVSGPATATISNPASASTSISALLEGIYTFKLTVADNEGATGNAQVTVTVLRAPNQAPTANAGSNITITLPVNSATLNGSGSDPDGSIASYSWTQVSGPATATISNPASASTSISALIEGVYTFKLTVADNEGATGNAQVTVTVLRAPNQAPTANAGSNITITLPQSSATLNGSGSDADGSIVGYNWTQVSGPATATISNPASAFTSISALIEGVYTFKLTVADNEGATGNAQVTVTVLRAPNQAPTANAGSNITITLPQSSATLSGSGSDADGYIVGYNWTQVSGPATATITSANGSVTSITGLVQGVYIFKLTVTDNEDATGDAQVTVTVLRAPNQAPTANAGSNITITLPVNSATLNGSGSDPDGSIASYSWTQVSGPATATIGNESAASTSVSSLVQGNYVFRLTVTDNEGASGSASVNVQVLTPANQPPVANAGNDITITLPVNSVTLMGSGTDPDNYIVAYRWTKVSGGAATITNDNLAQATVTGLVQGVYIFRLTVTDNSGATDDDEVTVTVLPAANVPPMVNAGNDQTITLPINWVVLNGSAIDADGTVVSYQWTKETGGNSFIQTPSSSVTRVDNLEEGLYTFKLTATDNDGATAYGEMHVLVLPAPVNIAPVANAGQDQTITLPQTQTTLAGSGSDADGQVVAYEWLKITGPAGGFVTNSNGASTDVTGLQVGVYSFQLIVTDNLGAIGRDTVAITVLPAAGNIAPTANAGPDLTVLIPISTVELHGSGSDPDGEIVRYRWNVLSGPNRPSLRGSNNSALYMSNLRQGVYTIELIVWDNDGAEGRDTMQLHVNQTQVTNDLPEDFIRTFPNPVVNRLTIHFRTYHQNRVIRCVLVDFLGMPVTEKTVMLSNFVNIFQLDVSTLHTGLYRLNIYSDGYPTVSLPIIKQ